MELEDETEELHLAAKEFQKLHLTRSKVHKCNSLYSFFVHDFFYHKNPKVRF